MTLLLNTCGPLHYAMNKLQASTHVGKTQLQIPAKVHKRTASINGELFASVGCGFNDSQFEHVPSKHGSSCRWSDCASLERVGCRRQLAHCGLKCRERFGTDGCAVATTADECIVEKSASFHWRPRSLTNYQGVSRSRIQSFRCTSMQPSLRYPCSSAYPRRCAAGGTWS